MVIIADIVASFRCFVLLFLFSFCGLLMSTRNEDLINSSIFYDDDDDDELFSHDNGLWQEN